MGRTRFLFSGTSCAVFLALVLNVALSFGFDEVPAQVVRAGEEGIATFVKNPEARNLETFGFAGKAQIDGATLGQGFQIFTIPPSRLLDPGVSREEMATLVLPSNMWQFLIVTEGQAVSLLTVDFFKGRWTAVSIGAAGLARELEQVLAAWPAVDGYQYRIVRVYQANASFLELFRSGNSLGVIPLSSARIAMGLAGKGFDPLDLRKTGEVSGRLRALVELNTR